MTNGDHVCWTYSDDETFSRVLIEYVLAGLGAGQRVACFVREEGAGRFADSLRRADLSVRRAERSGALVLGTFEDAYIPGGVFDPDARISDYERMADDARRDGFAGLRVMGDVTAVLMDEQNRRRWTAYELRADLLVTRRPLIALCAFDVREMDEEARAVLSALHPVGFGLSAGGSAFHVHATTSGGLALGGELDFASSEVIEHLADGAVSHVLEPALDVRDLSFVDVAGMRSVVRLARAVGTAHSRLEIRGAGSGFRRLWDLLECERIVGVPLGVA